MRYSGARRRRHSEIFESGGNGGKEAGMARLECLRCGAERPSWLGEPHRCVGDADLSWLTYHQMTAHAAMAWRRHLLADRP